MDHQPLHHGDHAVVHALAAAFPAASPPPDVSRHAVIRLRGTEKVLQGVRRAPAVSAAVPVPVWADEEWMRVRGVLEALQTVRPEAAGSHRSAAIIHGIPLPRAGRKGQGSNDPMRVHVTVPYGRRVARPGIVSHRADAGTPTQTVGGVRVHTRSRVLEEIAGDLTEDELVVVFDALLGRWHGNPIERETISTHLRSRRFRGKRAALRALERSREGVGSPPETRVRLGLVARGLPEPAVGVKIWVEALGMYVTPDLTYEQIRTVLEYEGDHHRTSELQFHQDLARYAALADLGWHVERITRATSLDDVAARVRRRFRGR